MLLETEQEGIFLNREKFVREIAKEWMAQILYLC